MTWAWVSVGTNVDREHHVRRAVAALRGRFGGLVISPVYETVAVGFEGNPFLNLVVGFDSDLPPAGLHGLLREIEAANGRERAGVRFGDRTLDLDLLTWGEDITDDGGRHLPRDEILKYAFVLRPLADVAGDEAHPEAGESYAALWANLPEAAKAGLAPYPMDLDAG